MANSVAPGAGIRIISESPRRVSPSVEAHLGSGPVRAGAPDRATPPSSILSWVHPEWDLRFPWLAQGTTGRSPGEMGGDFRVFDRDGSARENANWLSLASSQGFQGIEHARQVHGTEILAHRRAPAAGFSLGSDADGHASSLPGTLMGVTVADCVPVFLLDPRRRALAVLHAGWRGTAAGILEDGVRLLLDEFLTSVEDLLVHLGPSICGACYEVGPEVHVALGLPAPARAAPVDLRAVLAKRAVGLGILPAHVTRSSFCTRCDGSPFFSHRRGDPERQVGFFGIRSH